MVELFREDVDGVPCFWVETGRPTLTAVLLFRQGIADEKLTESGWLHLLEHLALREQGGGVLQINGSVSLLHTTFDSHGPPDAVARHLGHVTRWLSKPSFRDLDRERNVLRVEQGSRGGPFHQALLSRYGAHGPGVAGYEEPGLARATADRLRERAARAFVQGNCVLALDGPPPKNLRLHLEPGQFSHPSTAVPREIFPSAYPEPRGVIFSGVVQRTVPATLLPGLTQRALTQRLRVELGEAYSPWSDYEPVDAQHAVVAAGTDVGTSMSARVMQVAGDIAVGFGRDGVPEDWVADEVALRLQAMRDPYARFGLSLRAAHSWMAQEEPQSFEQLVESTMGITAGAVNDAARQLHETLMVGAPPSARPERWLPVPDFPERAVTAAGRWRHKDWPAVATTFSVDETAVALVDGSRARTIETHEVAGMFAYADGVRRLVSDAGWMLTMEPDQWHSGTELRDTLDRVIPDELRMPHAAVPRAPFERQSFVTRWRRLFKRPGLFNVVMWLLCSAWLSTTLFLVHRFG